MDATHYGRRAALVWGHDTLDVRASGDDGLHSGMISREGRRLKVCLSAE